MSVRRAAIPLSVPACAAALCLGGLTGGARAAAPERPAQDWPAQNWPAQDWPALNGPVQGIQAAQARPAPLPDPWPDALVLTRLFRLPAGQADAQRLIAALDLTVAQVRELQRLAGSETLYVQGAATPATQAKLAAMRAEKDRKVRLLLGAEYGLFRQLIRDWWREQLRRAGG
ncbi:hypothetical protein GCM10008959_08200 [Deinococcus seoulensis]|uniref:Periplasmic heavy metal sensor n=1 Tax=Deinococcus seoulensis TaxID=1837379 RepID=A0ABQ2RPA9_9DEIO|nr:hypothetical protein GCM10008959_08200 [Deinococcus seoulensis]